MTSEEVIRSHTPRRLLFLLPFAPRFDAAHGGARALAGLLEGLVARNRIAVLYLRGENEPPIDARLSEACEIVVEVRRPQSSRPRRQLRTAIGLLRLRPMWATKSQVREFAEHVTRLSAEWGPEIVQVEFSVMGQYLSALGECAAPRVLTIHDPGAESAQERIASAPLSARAFYVMEAWAWSRFERNIIDQVDAAVAFTKRDQAALLRRNPGALVTTISLGHPVPDVSLDPVGLHPPRILFVGNFMHPPNVDAARRLVEEILPDVETRVPEVILEIVGGGLPPDILAGAGTNVVATGMVPDVTPYLDRAAVVVAPLRQGGGMRVKVLEGFAAGKAVVASPLAVEGLDVTDGSEFVLAESDGSFADAVVQLLQDPRARLALAQRARSWAEHNLGWDPSVRDYEALYQHLLGGAKNFLQSESRGGGL